MARLLRMACVVAVLVASAGVRAQVSTTISEEDIARTARELRGPSDAEVKGILEGLNLPAPNKGSVAAGGPVSPRMTELPKPMGARTIDFGAVARGYGEPVARTIAGHVETGETGLLVFVSLGMPKRTLEALVSQAVLVRGALVIRGPVDGSLRKTVERVRELIGDRKVGFLIDPQAFERYGVSEVPAFVVTQRRLNTGACDGGACTEGEFVKVSGDVSVEYALDAIEHRSPAFAQRARTLRMRGWGRNDR